MPDNTNNIFSDNLNTDTNNTSNTDLLRALNEQSKYLESINNLLVRIQRDNETNNRRSYSQSDARYNSDFDFFSNRKKSTTEKQQDAKDRKSGNKNKSKDTGNEVSDIKETLGKFNKAFDDFFDSFESSFSKQLFGNVSLGKTLSSYIDGLAKAMGHSTEELPGMFGDELGRQLKDALTKNGGLGDLFNPLFKELNKGKELVEGYFVKQFAKGASDYQKKHGVDLQTNEGENSASFHLSPDQLTGANKLKLNSTEDLIKQVENLFNISKDEQDKQEKSEKTKVINNGEKSADKNIGDILEEATNASNIKIDVAYLDVKSLLDTSKTNMPNNGQFSEKKSDVLVDKFGNPLQSDNNKTTSKNTGSTIEEAKDKLQESDTTDTVKNTVENLGGVAKDAINILKSGSLDIGSALAGVVQSVGPVGVALTALKVGISLISPALEDFKNSLSEFSETMSSTANRDYEENEKRQKNAIDRLQSDVKTIIEEPFNILKDAANEVYQVWEAQLRTINGTQGYTKSDLQDLMSAYSARLQAEGLTNVVSSAEITEELAKVLNAGLSGQAAEEFAYIATVLNAAVPTQDFFDYVDTYTSIAGNMIAQGYSESEALQYANEQLEIFASNTLYASRQLAGGFTTGLTNASDLFQQSAQIAQTAGSNNVAEISSVLTAVSAITGSIAPDLANSMTDVIVQAATGGNSSELIALRSLAGTGASNTDFLNALVNDPQSVFVQLFNNLADLINTSDDAYMEVAGSLSEIFGISTDALRRIDFNYLAQAISEMNVSNASLDENLALLASGETTTSKEEERIAQINQYMIDEGLAYVLDNSAAQAIQQHMWDEELANEMMDAEYGVELIGSSKELITSLDNTMGNVLSMLSIIGKPAHDFGNFFQTATEAAGIDADIEAILEEGKVGEGNAKDLNNLIATGNRNTVKLTDDLLTIMQNTTSSYAAYNGLATSSNLAKSEIASSSSSGSGAYSWGTVSKSTSSAITSLSGGTPTGNVVEMPTTNQTVSAETEESINRLERNFNRFIDEEYVRGIVEEGGSYEDWIKTSRQYGIADFSAALEELGYTETQARDYFEAIQTEVMQEQNTEYYERQMQFWDNMEGYMDYLTEWLDEFRTFMEETIYQDALVDKIYQEALTDNIYQDALTDNIYQDALKDSIYTDALTNKIYQNALTDNIYTDALKDSIYQDALVDKVYKDALNDKIYETAFNKDDFYKKFKGYYSDWTDYYIKHTYYDAAYDYSNVSKVQSSEKNGSSDAIYALAEELTKNSVDLLQPEIQTNALLSQILLVVNAIMQQGNTASTTTSNGTTTMSLAETLSGLALGLYNTT